MTSITVHPKPVFNPWPVLAGKTGQVVFSFLPVAELEKVKQVSKKCIRNAELAERTQLLKTFPTSYLWLVGGSLESLKKLPLLVFGKQKPYASRYPDHFVGWTKVNINSWRLHVYKREVTADRTAKHLLVYHFVTLEKLKKGQAKLPDDPSALSLDSPESLESAPQVKQLVPYIASWILDGPRCSREHSCCEFTCCGHTWFAKPWVCWYQLGFCCGCTVPLTVERDLDRRHTRTYATYHPGENPQVTFSKDGVPYIPLQKPERKV